MKKIFLISLITFFISSLETVLAESNFDGIYIGGAFGRARGHDKGTEYKDNGNNFYGGTQNTTPSGNLFSAFVGANKVVKESFLLGAEIDFERRNYSHATFQEIDGSPQNIYPIETKVKNGGSLRARFGYIFNNDKSLAYLTSGFSTIKIQRSYGYTDSTAPIGTTQNITTRHNGYVAGFGLEHFLTKKISLRGEYRYVKYLAKNNIDTSPIYDTGTIEKQRFVDQSFRVGVAYNF